MNAQIQKQADVMTAIAEVQEEDDDDQQLSTSNRLDPAGRASVVGPVLLHWAQIKQLQSLAVSDLHHHPALSSLAASENFATFAAASARS